MTVVPILLAALTFAADAPGLDSYLEGLDALERGQWKAAAGAFDRAAAADSENPDFLVARGAAKILDERPTDAEKDLRRADKLRANHRPTKLWLATAVAMQGRFQEDVLVYPAATRDPYETSVREMSRQWGELSFRARNNPGESDPRWTAARTDARAKFRALGKQFAEKAKPAGADVAKLMGRRGVARLQKGDANAALVDLRQAFRADPTDRELARALADCQRELGMLEGARALYTRLLTDKPDAAAFLGRAFVHAEFGNRTLAEADFADGERLDQAAATDAKPRLDQKLAAPPNAALADRNAALAQLFARAQAGAKRDELQAAAVERVRELHAIRRRADEGYQRRLHELRTKAAAGGADELAELGRFLYSEAKSVLIEWVEPRADRTPYRPHSAAAEKAELAAAERALDAALAKQPKHVTALAFKAACLTERHEWDAALEQLEVALDLAPTNADVLGLMARVLDHIAMLLSVQAADLRSTKSWSDYAYIYYRYPSKSELAAAAELDAKARKLRDRARKSLDAAILAETGSAKGCYYEAVVAEWDGNFTQAKAALDRAVKLDPNYLDAWRQLAVVCMKLGLANESYAAQHEAANLSHTTAGPMLKLAWLHVARTAWESTEKALARAASVDPVDPRIAGYRGVVAEYKGDAAAALAWYRTALALDAAHRRWNALADFAVGGDAVNPDAAAFAMEIDNRAAKLLLASGKTQDAVDYLIPHLGVSERVPEAERYRPLAKAMLPAERDDNFLVPEAANFETLMAWSELTLGKALAAQGKHAEAMPHFQWTASFEARKPSVLDVGMTIRTPWRLALLELAKSAFARGDVDGAFFHLQHFGRPKDLPAEVEAEFQKLAQQIAAARQNGGGFNPNPNPGGRDMTLSGQRKRALLDERRELLARKTRAQKIVDDASATPFSKQQAERQIAQLDELLATNAGELQRLGVRVDDNAAAADDNPAPDPRKAGEIRRLEQQIANLERQLRNPRLGAAARRALETRLEATKKQLEQLKGNAATTDGDR